MGGSVRMSGGICVSVCDGNHPSNINAFALPPSSPSLLVLAVVWRLFRGRWSVATSGERISGEAGFDSVPGGPPEQQHHNSFSLLPSLSPHLFHLPATDASISKPEEQCFTLLHPHHHHHHPQQSHMTR